MKFLSDHFEKHTIKVVNLVYFEEVVLEIPGIRWPNLQSARVETMNKQTGERKYQFHWELLGDLQLGRPNLGNTTRLEVYRLMQFCFRDVLEQRYGAEATDRIFYDSGYLAGREFYQQLIGPQNDLHAMVAKLQAVVKEMGIGILRIEEADLEQGRLVLTVSEDLDCSGLPESGEQLCTYDEGFIAAILESFSGCTFKVKEVDCWCTGDRTCRFTAQKVVENTSES
jgi:uncharacterized protein